MEASDIKKMNDLEEENRLPKQMVTDISLECRALKEIIEKSVKTSDKARTHRLSFRLTVCNPVPLAMPEALNQSEPIDLAG